MRTPVYTNRVAKDLKMMIKRGGDPDHIKAVMQVLIEGEIIDRKYGDRALIGIFRDRRECHIKPDWLLIYRIDGLRIIFERTGSHADLFR